MQEPEHKKSNKADPTCHWGWLIFNPHIELTPTALQAIVDREIKQLEAEQARKILRIQCENVLRDTTRRSEIKRQSVTLCRKVCPALILVLGLFAWFAFAHGQTFLGSIYTVAALFFAGLEVYGELFARLHSPRL